MSQNPNHSLIYTYLKKYQQDPTSRVFAPLAEAYRKAGLADEAIEIAREGLKVHPHFVGGRVALGRALFDKRLFQSVVEELSQVVKDVPDNLVAQKLLAESFLMLGRIPEALNAYKMLLYFSPGDPEVAQIVQELESQAYEHGTLELQKSSESGPAQTGLPQFDVRPASEAFIQDEDFKRARKIEKIEFLQRMLQKIERYRMSHR